MMLMAAIRLRVLHQGRVKVTHPSAAAAARHRAEGAGDHEVGAALAPGRLLCAGVAAGRRHIDAVCA